MASVMDVGVNNRALQLGQTLGPERIRRVAARLDEMRTICQLWLSLMMLPSRKAMTGHAVTIRPAQSWGLLGDCERIFSSW